MELIDKADIISEIERRIKELEPFKTEDNLRAHGAIAGYYQIISFIRNLEVTEVDLEKELQSWYRHTDDCSSEISLAKHFFELGIKAKDWKQERRMIMTDKEKAKAYDEVVNKLARFMEQGVDQLITRADVKDFFPELKDSEDEEIRKDIVTYLLQLSNSATLKVNAQKFNKWIAWLEKQVEQKPADDVKPKFKHGDRPNNEKKFTWSEEDENNLTDTCVAIRKFYHRNNGAQDLIDWLQSLKERMKGMNE